jgi:hypothetical protein
MRLLLNWWVPLDRTDFLARSVNPLSTKVIADHLVSLSAAFLKWWRFHYHATLFIHHSSVCLASSSVPLRTYVFNPNNYFCLASFRRPYCLATKVLSTFHVALEQSFAFYIQTRSWTQIDSLRDCCFTIKQFANLPRSAAPVAPYLVRYGIPHS